MRIIRIIIFCLCAALLTISSAIAAVETTPTAFIAAADSITYIEGTWQVKKGIPGTTPEELSGSDGWIDIKVPGNLMDIFPGYKEIAWYKTAIIFPEINPAVSYVLKLGKICNTDIAWLNGFKIGNTGDPDSEEPPRFDRERIYYIPASLINPGRENILLVKTRGYLDDSAGLVWHRYELGRSDMMNRSIIASYAVEVLIAGIYMFIAFYFLIFSRIKSSLSRQQFVLSIISLCLSIYILCQGQFKYIFFTDMFPFHYAQYMSGMIGTFFVLLLFRYMFKETLTKADIAGGISLLLAAVYITLTMNILEWTIPRTIWHIFGFYVALIMITKIFSAIINRKKEYMFLILGFFITITSSILEILRAVNIVPDFDYMAFGIIGLIINISFFLADQISIVQRIEAGNREMLEATVQQRTKELDDRNKTIEDQLVIARQIQRKLMPEKFPEFAGVKIEAVYMPIDMVGGDFYTFHENQQEIRILIGDVSGHGVPGAFLALIAKMAFQQVQDDVESPDVSLAFMNKIICESSVLSHFATAFILHYNKKSGRIIFSNAGHIPAIIIRKELTVDNLYVKGTLLGINRESPYDLGSNEVTHGDRLVLYTDGIIECSNIRRELFGENRLIEFLKSRQGSGIRQLKADLVAELTAFTGGSFDDDITLLTVDII
jgi:serine phosphatase RsbU (regulator of sigma subunit)